MTLPDELQAKLARIGRDVQAREQDRESAGKLERSAILSKLADCPELLGWLNSVKAEFGPIRIKKLVLPDGSRYPG